MTNKELKEFSHNAEMLAALEKMDIEEKLFDITELKEVEVKRLSVPYLRKIDFKDGKGLKDTPHMDYNGTPLRVPNVALRQFRDLLKKFPKLKTIKFEKQGKKENTIWIVRAIDTGENL